MKLHSQTRLFRVTYGTDGDDGLTYSVDGGEPRGPFADELERERDLVQLIARWRSRARALGGTVVRTTRETFLVTLPPEHPIEGGEPLEVRTEPARHWDSVPGRRAA